VSEAAAAKIAVLAVGNVLMQDDAVGPYVLAELVSRFEMPSQVRIEDLGTPGLDLHPHLMDLDAAVFIDAIQSTDAPGTVRRLDRGQLLAAAPAQRTGGHDPALREALLALEFNGRAPKEIFLIGIVPAATSYVTGLTEPVREAVEQAVAMVVDTLRDLGHAPRRRPEALPVDNWWEHAAPSSRNETRL